MRNVRHNSILKKAIIGLSAAVVLFTSSGAVYADQFDDAIAAAKQEAAAAQAEAAKFHNEANSAQAKINQLNFQIRTLQNQINLNEAQARKLARDIEEAQQKLAHQKEILGDIVKTMYFDSTISPIEMLASSSNISEFLDAEQYRESIKDKIQSSMTEIQTLKKSLEDQQTKLNELVADQKNQQQSLALMRNEANQLLVLASQSAAAADAEVKSNNSKVAELRAQQAAILAARFGNSGLTGGGACGGGYPAKWCNLPFPSSVADNWGMYAKQCVSYVAFKVAVSGRNMPYWGGRGNANQWDDNARAAGIPVNSTPRAGDIAQTDTGPYGHVMHVDAVLGDGRIRISQYNYGNRGEYSEMTIPAAGLNFIHFP